MKHYKISIFKKREAIFWNSLINFSFLVFSIAIFTMITWSCKKTNSNDMALKNSVSGLGLHAQGKKSLSDILAEGKIPSDLSNYDTLSQQLFSPHNAGYKAGAAVLGIYITSSGAGKQDGSSWENAYSSDKVESVLDNISDANENKVYLILMGAGTYAPAHGLVMKNYVGLVGGFPLAGGWARKATDITTFNGNNAHGLFQNSNIDHSALLYGVSVINGNEQTGAGMHNYHAAPSVINVIFDNNHADIAGGGMYNEDISAPIVINVIFRNNSANASQDGTGGGMGNIHYSNPMLVNVRFENNRAQVEGGGMYNEDNSNGTLTNVIFENNSAGSGGGGMSNESYSNVTLTNVIFRNNSVSTGGGGMYNNLSNPNLTNVVFQNNSANKDYFGGGGGMANDNFSNPTVTNAIFIGNSAERGGGMYNEGGSSPRLISNVYVNNQAVDGGGVENMDIGTSCFAINCIFWGNNQRQYHTTYFYLFHSVWQIDSQNPMLSDSLTYTPGYFMPTITYTGSSPDNFGVYIKRSGGTYFYSTDGSNWYTDPNMGGTSVTPPGDAIEVTATDIQGRPRIGRPDAGAWAKHSS